ncbi:hypothetical protein [Nocardia sp. NPDC050406]|uniref:hypothetical protein n=1 Tax=Nocardia sp. NPDC050406 TaxID=3364318 RepID=UPI0037BC534A
MSEDQPALLAGLREVLSCTGPTCGDTIDWPAAQGIYGAAFPADYRAFVAAFGSGTIADLVVVHIPAVSLPRPIHTVSRISEAVRGTHVEDEWVQASRGRYRMEDLLIWGETTAADTLCWVTTDPDPNRWPVAVHTRMDSEWAVYPCGMVEFLVKLLRNEWQRWPVSEASWHDTTGIVRQHFLHEKDEATAGLDRWQ